MREELERFATWRASLDVVPTIAALRDRGDRIVDQVLHENSGRWTSMSEDDRERVEVLARAIVSRMLHEPTLRLKGASADGESYVYIQALRELFGLEPDGSAAAAPGSDVAAERGGEVASLDDRRRRRSGA